VGDEHQRHAAPARQVEHQREHRVGAAAIEVAGRLVGEDAIGRAGERARDRDPLALAARELRRPVLEPRAEAELAERVGGARPRLDRGDAADAQRHGDVVERRELGQEMVELVDEAEMAIAPFALRGRVEGREVASAEVDVALSRRLEAAEQMQQRALARSRRADDGERLAASHLEVDALEHVDVDSRRAAALGEALVQSGGDDHRLGARTRRGRCRRRVRSLAQPHLTHSAAPRPAAAGSRASSDRASPGKRERAR
jgi:hypothetical protein